MKRIFRFCLVLFMILSSMFLAQAQVHAVESFSVEAEFDREQIYAGDSVELTIRLKDLVSIDAGLNAYEATLEYDDAVFEQVTQSNFTSKNKWISLEYNKLNHRFIAYTKGRVLDEQEVATIKLVAKRNARPQYTIVNISNFVASEGKRDITASANAMIDVVRHAGDEDEQFVTNSNSSTTAPNTGYQYEITPEYLSKQHLVYVVAGVVAVLVFIVFAFVRNRHRNTENIDSVRKIILMAIGLFTITSTVLALGAKGDVNGDGYINDADIEVIKRHIVALHSIDGQYLKYADMNNDNKITVTDLSLVIKKVEENKNYTIQIDDVYFDNKYPEKNTDIVLNINATISDGAIMEQIRINGKDYDVVYNNQKYIVTLPGYATAGLQELKLEAAKLDSEYIVKLNTNVKVDILKDAPNVDNYAVEENPEKNEITIYYDIIDKDGSFKNAHIHVYDDGGTELADQENNTTGSHSLTIGNMRDGEKYRIQICVMYDRDSNAFGEEANELSADIYKDYVYAVEYNATISNIELFNNRELDNPVAVFSSKDRILLIFDFKNDWDVKIGSVKVNGKYYSQSTGVEFGNQLVFDIDNNFGLGENMITIEEVILENGKELPFDLSTRIQIEKAKPSVEITKFEETTDNLKVILNVTDPDTAAVENKVSVYSYGDGGTNEQLIGTQVVAANSEQTVNFALDSDAMPVSYKVVVESTYSVNNLPAQKQTIYENTHNAMARVKLVNTTINKNIIDKGEVVDLTYEINSNYGLVSKLIVDHYELVPTRNGNLYTVKLDTATVHGEYLYHLTNIFIGDEKIDLDSSVKVYVKKDKPSVEILEVADDVDNLKATFKVSVDDLDGAMTGGAIELFDENDTNFTSALKTVNLAIRSGEQEVKVDVENGKKYLARVRVDYDIDVRDVHEDIFKGSVFTQNKYQLIADENLQILESSITNKDYMVIDKLEKGDVAKLQFKAEYISESLVEKVIISGDEYDVEARDGKYYVELPMSDVAGKKDYVLEKLLLANKKKITVPNITMSYQILKSEPNADGFVYVENDQSEVEIYFNLNDDDDTLSSQYAVIKDEGGNQVHRFDDVKVGPNTFTAQLNDGQEYMLEIMADYSRDIEKSSEYTRTNEKISAQEIALGERKFELKNFGNVNLYKKIGSGIELMDELDVDDFMANYESDYIAEITMDNLDNFYTTVSDAKIEDDVLGLTLEHDNLIQYDGNKKSNKLTLTYGSVMGDVAYNSSVDTIVKRMLLYPESTIKLTADIDALSLGKNGTVFPSEFRGTLDGNGHTIRNLRKPLFQKLENATVKDLIVENADVNANSILAVEAAQAKIRGVHVINSNLSGGGHTGALVGAFSNGSADNLIEESSVSHTNVRGGKRTGALVGWIHGITTVRNSYAYKDTVTTWSDAEAGFVGEADSGRHSFENVYADVETKFTTNTATGGICGYTNLRMTNVLSLVTGIPADDGKIYGRRVAGNGSINGGSSNIWELEDSNLISDAGNARVNTVNRDRLKDPAFYAETLTWSDSIWDWSEVVDGDLPKLKNYDPRGNEAVRKPSDSSLYIPEYDRISRLGNYDDKKDVLYANLYKLMPYYESKYVLIDGAKLSYEHELNKKKIKTVIPVDVNDQVIFGATLQNPAEIKAIKIMYEDGKVVKYGVTFKEVKNNIANFEIPDLNKIGYNYRHYLVDTNSAIYKELLSVVQNATFDRIGAVTTEDDVRAYSENWPKALTSADNFVKYLLANNTEYNSFNQDSLVVDKINDNLYSDDQIYKLLYAYNYFDRLYDVTIGGMNLRDVAFFDASIFTDKLSSTYLTKTLMEETEGNRQTWNYHSFYNNHMKAETGAKLGDFIDTIVARFEKEDTNQWFREYFDGTIYEAPAEDFKDPSQPDFLEYRAWPRLKGQEHMILPFLTYHHSDLYLASYPTGMTIGNLKRYFSKDWSEVTDQDIEDLMKPFFDSIGLLYNTVAKYVSPGTLKFMQEYNNYGYDSTGNRPRDDIKDENGNVTMEGLAFKPGIDRVWQHVYEVINVWPRHGSAGAFANTVGGVYYCFYGAIDRNNRVVWSHENAHNQDRNVFMDMAGLRVNTVNEMTTDGFLTQQFGSNEVHTNLMWNYNITDDFVTNLRSDRLAGREKIESYYRHMFEVFAMFEYLEGKAFLEMTPEQQSQIASVLVENDAGTSAIRHDPVSAETLKSWKLDDFDDLWDHKLVANRNEVNDKGNFTGYAGSSLFVGSSPWYVTAARSETAENGMNGSAYRTMAYRILGEFGYPAFTSYVSGRRFDKANDVVLGGNVTGDAALIKDYMGDENATWRSYQLERYRKVGEKIANSAYIDGDAIKNKMKEAMLADIEIGRGKKENSMEYNLRKQMYGYFKRVTDDFQTSIYDGIDAYTYHVSTPTELMALNNEYFTGHIVLDKDIDMSSVAVSTETYLGNFGGSIDGNGYKITGLSKPLFKSLTYSYVENLTIEGANIVNNTSSRIGAIAKTMNYGKLKDITINDVLVRGEVAEGNITSVGGLIGEATRVSVSDIKATGVNIYGAGHDAGGLFGRIQYSTIENAHISDSEINGNARDGGIAGYANGMLRINNSSANVDVTARGNESGAFVGQLDRSYVYNSYVLGTVNGRNNIGGFAGYAAGTIIDKAYAKVEVTATSGEAGGFIGSGAVADNIITKVTNSAAFGKVVGGYKFDGRSAANVLNTYVNNFEYGSAVGKSTIHRNTISDWRGKIDELSDARALETEFYTGDLQFGDGLWSFNNVNGGGLPKLKSKLDTNNVLVIVDKIKIRNMNEFVDNITAAPDKIFSIEQDIDMSDFEGDSVIGVVFTGRIDGNGRSIKNLNNAALFTQFNGTVRDLKVMNFTNERIVNNSTVAFAMQTNGATFENVTFENITLKGEHRVAIIGTDSKGSIFNKIVVKNADIDGTKNSGAGVYVSAFIGRKYGGSIKNAYVQGKIVSSSTEAGGVMGASQEGGQFENIIANVDMTMNENRDRNKRNNNAGVVGNIYNAPKFKNSIAIGDIVGYASGDVMKAPFKFSGADEAINSAQIEGCYEVSDKGGLPSVTTTNINAIKTVNTNGLKNVVLYRDTMKFNAELWDFSSVTTDGYPTPKFGI